MVEFGNLATVLAAALSPENLLFCFVGVVLGTLVGVLPGLGDPAGIAILIPITSGLNPTTTPTAGPATPRGRLRPGIAHGSLGGSSPLEV